MANGAELGKYYIQIVPTTEGISGSIESALDKSAEGAGSSMGSKIASGIGQAAKAIGAATTTAIAKGGAALTSLTKNVIGTFAEYEQLSGGVETLFKNGADTVKAFADQAYKSAGLSANEYMSTVTTFSASLIAGLKGDTKKAAVIADMAVIDMADNANKMGTSIESIQFAYAGFAKQNYTMLDNLKLGYGGTQAEMVRLINDSGVLNKKIESMDGISFDTIISAIHKVQENLGIAGATAEEAEGTIEGSMNSMKAAWKNLLTGMGRGNIDGLVKSFVDSISSLSKNIVEALKRALPQIVNGIRQLVKMLVPMVPPLLNELLPTIVMAVFMIVTSLFDVLPGILEAAASTMPDLVGAIMKIAEKIIGLLPAFMNAIVEMLPSVLPLLLSGAIKLVGLLMGHLPEIILAIVQAMPEIVTTIEQTLLDNLPILIEGAIQLVAGLVAALPEILMKIWETIKGVFKAIFKKLGQFISDSWDAIKDVFKRAFNAIIWLLNKTIDGVNVILTPLRAIIWGVGGLFGLNWSLDEVAIPHIPLLANGGILKEGRAIVGEKGPELLEVYGGQAKVTPLSAGDRTDIGAITINVYAAEGQDPRSIAEAVSEELARAYQRKAAVFA